MSWLFHILLYAGTFVATFAWLELRAADHGPPDGMPGSDNGPEPDVRQYPSAR